MAADDRLDKHDHSKALVGAALKVIWGKGVREQRKALLSLVVLATEALQSYDRVGEGKNVYYRDKKGGRKVG